MPTEGVSLSSGGTHRSSVSVSSIVFGNEYGRFEDGKDRCYKSVEEIRE